MTPPTKKNNSPSRPSPLNKIYTRQIKKSERLGNWRLNFWFILVFLVLIAIIHRLFVVQVLSHEELFSRAQSQHQYYEELTPRRGEIYLQNKGKTYPASINEEMDTVVAIPKNIDDVEGTVMTLATVLNLPAEEIRQKITKNREDMYEVIKRKLTDDESLTLQNKNLKGVELIPEYWRVYPASPLASQTIGFLGYTGEDKIGQYGIEGYFDGSLKGKGGFMKAEKDTGGRWISIGLRTLQKAQDGDNLVLTIEQSVQNFVEHKLEEAVQKFDATGGNIIIMNPKTGRIIAMANYPSYDDSDYQNVKDAALFQNKCIQEQYEPGSIMKPVTYAIALDTGRMEPETLYHDAGSVTISGRTMHNFDGKGRGTIPMTKALELSLNTGAIFAQQSAGKEKFYEYFKNFGFGSNSGIDLVGEAKGDIKNLSQMQDLTFATAAFGQGVAVTPLQMASAISALVNGGHLMKPQIVEKVIKSDGEETVIPPKEIRQVISEKTSSKIKAMMVSVVKNGWSVKAAVPGYLIGAKTGTAQMPNGSGGYSDDFIHSFIAAAPMNDPQFVIIFKLDRVRRVKFSSDSVSPLTRPILEFLFDYYNISPTEEITDKDKEQYNHYSAQLKSLIGTDSSNPQEANATNNIEKQINSNTNNSLDNSNKNDNQNKKTDKQKDNSNSNTSIHTLINNSGAGD